MKESTYPQSNFIKFSDSKRSFYYEIIKEGVYPRGKQLCYTKKPNKHPIPHNYIVKTQFGKLKHLVECSIEYVETKPLFKIRFGTNFTKEVQSSLSTTDAACKYYQVCFSFLIQNFSFTIKHKYLII